MFVIGVNIILNHIDTRKISPCYGGSCKAYRHERQSKTKISSNTHALLVSNNVKLGNNLDKLEGGMWIWGVTNLVL